MRRPAIALFFAVLIAALYWKASRLWWTYDDAFQIHLVVEHPLTDSFTDSTMWPQKLFTPLMAAAYEAQLAAFGLEPSRWYIVHLLLLSATALALFATLRLWLSTAAATAGAVMFVAAVPLCALVAVLGGTHYFQAILLACLSTIAFVRAAPDATGRAGRDVRRNVWLLLSAALYLLAMLAKETVVPLVVLLAIFDWRRARPHAVALAIYLLWRRAVIGAILGGYGWAIETNDWPRLIATLPEKIARACMGPNLAAGGTLLAVTAIGVALAVRSRRAVVLFLIALALAVGPIVPVSKEMQPRYALMPWLAWSVAFVAGTDRLRRGKVPLLVAACAILIIANRQEWIREHRRSQRMSDEARLLFDLPPGALLRNPTVPPAAMGETAWLRSYSGRPGAVGFFFDDYFACSGAAAGRRIFEYEPRGRTAVEVEPAKIDCAARTGAGLQWQFWYRDGVLSWRFGPWQEGRYRVLIGDGVQAFDVPRADSFRLPEVPGLALRIRYDSPEGWRTYSPQLQLKF